MQKEKSVSLCMPIRFLSSKPIPFYFRAHKKVEAEDLRFPMIMGEGRRARLLATIGLTRGLGDHNLKVFDSAIRIKPFLSCIPAVSCLITLNPVLRSHRTFSGK